MKEETAKLFNQVGVEPAKMSGRELASYLVLSELLSTLVKEGHLNQEQVHDVLWTAGMRLYCIRCDLAEMGSPIEGKRLEDDGQHLINLIDKDVETSTRFSAQTKARLERGTWRAF